MKISLKSGLEFLLFRTWRNNNMIEINNLKSLTLRELEQRANSGSMADVDFLMENLEMSRAFGLSKMIDFALGLVSSDEGRSRIRYFLFNGTLIQRNHAALYFKRRGNIWVLEEAVQCGCIDKTQAYSR
jgi:hypothetical protein